MFDSIVNSFLNEDIIKSFKDLIEDENNYDKLIRVIRTADVDELKKMNDHIDFIKEEIEKQLLSKV